MKVIFDIGHPAQLNYYLNTIKLLSDNNDVIVTLIDRGKLYKITKKELKEFEKVRIVKIGKHKGTKLSTIFDANVFRLLQLFVFYFKNRPDISIGNGFLHGISGRLLGIPVLIFNDDVERKLNNKLMVWFSSEFYHVAGKISTKQNKNITSLNVLKEWSYLAPKYFKPNVKVLENLNLEPYQYIFVREVINGTLNYANQESNIVASIADQFPKDIKFLLSLEDKKMIHKYPKNWILLNEPIEEIHSLIYFSKLLVSSGDSMAREAAVLGVPSIYCGVREMKANKAMIDKGKLYFLPSTKVANMVREISRKNMVEYIRDKQIFREELEEQWMDLTNFILERVDALSGKSN